MAAWPLIAGVCLPPPTNTRGLSSAGRGQDGVEQLTSVRFVEYLAYPRGGVGSLRRAGIRRQPIGGGHLGDVPELRDEHREVPAPVHRRWAAGLPVCLGQRTGPSWVGAAELEQDTPEFLVRVSQAAVLPVDDAQPAVRGRQDVVGPQVAMTGPNHLRGLDPGLQRDQFIAQACQLPGEGRARLKKLPDQL